ncbi:MAG: glycosyl hydrolase family 32, partial [Alphaproteobacteria bacterium]
MYRPDSHYLWDFWLQQRDGLFHLFHLQAPRTPDDPELRHGVATVGHAVSRDLRHWRARKTALDTGAPGTWDDRAIWTGSVLDLGGRYAMLYTGTNHAEDGKVQRVGLSLSGDLERWERHPANPVILADLRWYRGQNPDHRGELAWRDPWLMRDPDGNGFVALLTAQAAASPRYACGCIALARSADLVHWRVEPPLAV